ncbi:alpha-L-rhamnosidase C-terminal domain-containing protein [Streptomyces sp. NPDC086077]|uniref:alpha-L-rhamnosidase C-terminal domain-containing protein n=1 Tax=Streptomyces sp. NPDC086077 TaxID=3154862 RepID=UPI003417627F
MLYCELVIDPRIVGDLTHVEGSYRTPYGEAASEWTLKDGTFRLHVQFPPNTTAEVRVPRGRHTHQDAPRGADPPRGDGDRAVYRVSSGTYSFTVRGVRAAA